MTFLMKDKGITVNLLCLKPRNASIKKLFSDLTHTLDVMGIKYTVPKPYNIRVLTTHELEKIRITQTMLSNDIVDVMSYYQMGTHYEVKMHSLKGKRAKGVIIDDPIP